MVAGGSTRGGYVANSPTGQGPGCFGGPGKQAPEACGRPGGQTCWLSVIHFAQARSIMLLCASADQAKRLNEQTRYICDMENNIQEMQDLQTHWASPKGKPASIGIFCGS